MKIEGVVEDEIQFKSRGFALKQKIRDTVRYIIPTDI